MIIADFIQLERKPKRNVPRSNERLAQRVDQAVALVDHFHDARRAVKSLEMRRDYGYGYGLGRVRDHQDDLSRSRNKFDEARQLMEEERFDIFEIMGGVIPERLEFCSRTDPLSIASVSPRSSLDEIRQIADMLGFIVMPFGCMDERAWEGESREVQNAIENFYKGMRAPRNVYALSPVEFYDFYEHVSLDENLPFYAPPQLQQTFASIEVMLPFCRTMYRRIERNKEDMDLLAEEINGVKKRLARVEYSVSRLEQIYERERREQAARRARAAAEERARRLAMWREPLMFAVNKEHDVATGSGQVILGPCWGPDFDDILSAMVTVKKKKGQRKKLELSMQRWDWN